MRRTPTVSFVCQAQSRTNPVPVANANPPVGTGVLTSRRLPASTRSFA
jgi:hypothetical protein